MYVLKRIVHELKEHARFTAFGAVTGIVIMLVMTHTGVLSSIYPISHTLFYILHPAHVILSAIATTAMYRKNKSGWNPVVVIIIGYAGSIGIATLSDSLIPYLMEAILDLPNREIHLGFIEEPWIVNPAALLGIIIGMKLPLTKIPHSGHVLLSTWASLFHILMAMTQPVNWVAVTAIFLFLFLAVWIPCCTSDIVFPLLFIKGQKE
jgi:hypothetical protein